MAKRGRPKKIQDGEVDLPKKFKRIHKFSDGTSYVWNFDLEKNPYGPVSVTMQ